MEDFRSYSYSDGKMDMVVYDNSRQPYDPNDLRCYSASYASSQANGHDTKEFKLKKGKSFSAAATSSSASSSTKGGWSFTDPELQRKKRVAGYKAYAVEGKMKGSLRKSFRWLKDRYTQVVYGQW